MTNTSSSWKSITGMLPDLHVGPSGSDIEKPAICQLPAIENRKCITNTKDYSFSPRITYCIPAESKPVHMKNEMHSEMSLQQKFCHTNKLFT